MLDSLGWGEMSVLLVLALFVFGPDRLPSLAADAGRALRSLQPRRLAERLLDEDDASTRVR